MTDAIREGRSAGNGHRPSPSKRGDCSGLRANPPGPPARRLNPPRRTDHTYRDYSCCAAVGPWTGKKTGEKFPSKLHRILSAPEFAHIISWMPHGRAWKIHDKERLMRDVVPQYFAQSKYESFTRQLSGWGFKRLHQSGNDFNAHYHECFLRGLPHLTGLLKRATPNQGKLIPYVEGEPNFYAIDRQFPLQYTAPLSGSGSYSPPPAHATMVGADHGAPPEPTAGYLGPEHYAPHPSNYPPPPPPQYYSGHPGDPNAAAAYAPPPGYPRQHFYAGQYVELPPRQYPHYPSCPQMGNQFHCNNYPQNHETGPVQSGDIPLTYDHPIDPRERVPTEGEADENFFRPHECYQHCPHQATPPSGAQSHSLTPPSTKGAGPLKSGGSPSGTAVHGENQEGRALDGEEWRGDGLEQWDFFGESCNTSLGNKPVQKG